MYNTKGNMTEENNTASAPKGRKIGGFLAVMGFILIAGLILQLYELQKEIREIAASTDFATVIDFYANNIDIMIYATIVLIISGLLVLTDFYIIYLFFAKRKSFIKYYILLKMLFIFVNPVLVMILKNDVLIPPELFRFVVNLFTAIFIFFPYLLYSKRSNETFVN